MKRMKDSVATLLHTTQEKEQGTPKVQKRKKNRVGTTVLAGAFFMLVPFFAAEPALAGGDIVTGINNLRTIVESIFRAAGFIWGLFGVFELAKGFISHNPSDRNMGIMSIIAGLILIFSPSILNAIAG